MVQLQKSLSPFSLGNSLRNFILLILAAGLVSCTTLNQEHEIPGYPSGYLQKNASVYLQMNLKEFDSLKARAEKEPDFAEAVKRTSRVWGAVELKYTKVVGFELLVQGDFPKGLLGLYLDLNSQWKKVDTQPVQWHSLKHDLYLTLPEDGLVMISNHVFTTNDLTWNADEHALLATLQSSSLGVWINHPVEVLFGPAAEKIFNIDSLKIPLKLNQDQLEGPIICNFAEERRAKAGLVMMKLLMGFKTDEMPSLPDLEWTQQDTQLIGQTYHLPLSQILQLMDKMMTEKKTQTDIKEAKP